MRKTTLTFALLLLILLMQSCIPTGNPVPAPTKVGLIENNQSYCGGAAPPQELLDELAIFHASANQTFYIRKGNSNTPFTPVYKTFTTDALGNYSVQLPAGNYAVISEEKYFTESISDIDSTCDYLKTPDFNFVVTSIAQQTYNKQFTKTCNYVCMPYLPG